MFGHEGKKLLFMGQEFAQEREWSEARELDWYMLQDELNSGMLEYVKTLLNLYRKYPCLHEIDNDWNGFEWVNADDAERSTYSFIRKILRWQKQPPFRAEHDSCGKKRLQCGRAQKEELQAYSEQR